MGNVETEKNAFEVFAVFVKRLLSVLSIALGTAGILLIKYTAQNETIMQSSVIIGHMF